MDPSIGSLNWNPGQPHVGGARGGVLLVGACGTRGELLRKLPPLPLPHLYTSIHISAGLFKCRLWENILIQGVGEYCPKSAEATFGH